ncbi:hypothetical protein CRENBAI_022634 [Crenichthys baileyi]|uniref:Transmembrane protein 184B n=1 Tax=Crenichthys baileyi TaxID=28760 RepID=A0AAV9RPZ5_9TELE
MFRLQRRDVPHPERPDKDSPLVDAPGPPSTAVPMGPNISWFPEAPLLGTDQPTFLMSPAAQAISGFFVWTALILTCHQIYMHLRFYSSPREQRHIVRILFIVPIYAFDSWLSLLFFTNDQFYVYFDTIRDCYEAFVIYNLPESVLRVSGGERRHHGRDPWETYRVQLCVRNAAVSEESLLHRILRSVSRPPCSSAWFSPHGHHHCWCCRPYGKYNSGEYQRCQRYPLRDHHTTTSQSACSLYALFLFYFSTASCSALTAYAPFFMASLSSSSPSVQGMLLAILEKCGAIPQINSPEVSVGEGTVAAGYQNFIICIEMFFAALALRHAFTYRVYMDKSLNSRGLLPNYGEFGRCGPVRASPSSLKERNPGYMVPKRHPNFLIPRR